MRKLILIAALVLVSATAQAGTKRGLTVASNEATATEAATAAETPKYAARPAAADMRAQRLKAEQAKRLAAKDPERSGPNRPNAARIDSGARGLCAASPRHLLVRRGG